MYSSSPMERYNKNNPFIIIAKKTYDKIVDKLQLMGKECIIVSIVNIVLLILFIASRCILVINNDSLMLSVILILALLVINILSIYHYRSQIAYFISLHPAMKEFDRLSKLEVNNILSLNNEDILNCVHAMHTLYGELIATTKYLRILMVLLSIVEIGALAGSIAKIILIY